jgi:hypothetical protein
VNDRRSFVAGVRRGVAFAHHPGRRYWGVTIGTHVSVPDVGSHAWSLGEQQSVEDVHAAPSARQPGAHASTPAAPGAQTPLAQSVGSAHGDPGAPADGASAQRLGAPAHVAPSQHGAAQASPTAVHVVVADGAQRRTPSVVCSHTPEQHAASLSQSSHCREQPPAATHLFGPLGAWRQLPEQQAASFWQTSPTWFAHEAPLAVAHALSAAQRAMSSAPTTQRPEQQSPAPTHCSSSTRHASSRAHRFWPGAPGRHAPEQQPTSFWQSSPAAPQLASAQAPATQRPLQQSLPSAHAPPSLEQGAAPSHTRPSLEGAQPSEQQADAKLHGSPSPSQPIAG